MNISFPSILHPHAGDVELDPGTQPEAVGVLRGKFAPIVCGDVVLIEYSPAKGTSVRVNKGIAVRGASHD